MSCFQSGQTITRYTMTSLYPQFLCVFDISEATERPILRSSVTNMVERTGLGVVVSWVRHCPAVCQEGITRNTRVRTLVRVPGLGCSEGVRGVPSISPRIWLQMVLPGAQSVCHNADCYQVAVWLNMLELQRCCGRQWTVVDIGPLKNGR